MGIYDRDWYRDHAKRRDKTDSIPRTDAESPKSQPATPARKEVGFEIFGDWHWSLIAIFWVVLALVLALGLKYFR
jgi:hypothetical protein